MNSKHAANVLIPVCLIAVGAGVWWQWPAPPAPTLPPTTPTEQLPPPLPQPKRSPQADLTNAPAFEFDGVVVTGGKTTVSLVNLSTGDANWVAVGGKFDGYTVSKYVPDPKGADVVELSKSGGGQTLRVGLKTAVILEATPGPVTDEQRKAVNKNLERILEEANAYFAVFDGDTVEMDKIIDPFLMSHDPVTGEWGNPSVTLTPVAGENYTGMVIKRGQNVITVTLSDGSVVSAGPDGF